ncbi:MAG TPA: hypothetical protein VLA70_11575 [Nocardioides sp.]|nr:hypothetical protein [Nocardioides sp.]
MTRHLSLVGSLLLAVVFALVGVGPAVASAPAADGVALTVTAPRSDKLVKGVWTRISVTVTNTSAVPAEDVQVIGSGTGIRFRKLSVGGLGAQDSRTGLVWAKLRVASSTLKLEATELGTSLARTSVRLALRPAPLPPRATGWSGDGVGFQLLGGQINVLTGKVRTSCGTQDFLFPAISVPRNNEVYGTAVGADGSQMVLELDFVSTTRGVGSMTWSYDSGCRGVLRFTVHANL